MCVGRNEVLIGYIYEFGSNGALIQPYTYACAMLRFHRYMPYLKEFTIWYKTIVVHVIDTKSESKLWQFIAFNAKLWDALNKFFEIHLAIAVRIKYIDDTLHQRVLL